MKGFLLRLTRLWSLAGPGCSGTNQSASKFFGGLRLGSVQSDRPGIRIVPFAI